MVLALEDMGFIPEQEWEYIAEKTQRSVGQAKRDYRDALAAHLANPRPVLVTERTGASGSASPAEGPVIDKTFDITVVPGVLTLELSVNIETGPDWHGRLGVSAKVFGFDVGSSGFEISRTNSYVEIHPGVALAKADLKIGLYGERLCFGVEGQGCYWALGWHCTPINAPALFCLLD